MWVWQDHPDAPLAELYEAASEELKNECDWGRPGSGRPRLSKYHGYESAEALAATVLEPFGLQQSESRRRFKAT